MGRPQIELVAHRKAFNGVALEEKSIDKEAEQKEAEAFFCLSPYTTP